MEVITELTGFERFVHERSRGLWRAAWLLTGDSQHADDLVQTALAKTWGKYDSMENDNQFEAYVRTTIYRTFCSWWRRSSWRNEHPTEILPEQAHAAADQGMNLDLRRALDELPRMQRSVIVMQYFEDLPLDQIAQRLDIALGTAKAHASRAKAALRESPHLASEAAVAATDPTTLREGARRKRRNAQFARVAVAVVALVAMAVPVGLLWPGTKNPQVAEPSPTPSVSVTADSEAPESTPQATQSPSIDPAADAEAPVDPEGEADPEGQVPGDTPEQNEDGTETDGPGVSAPAEGGEEPSADPVPQDALALVDPQSGIGVPAPKACFDGQGQLLQPSGGTPERGATRAWLCTDPSWYAEASPLEPLVVDVDRIVEIWDQLPAATGNCLSETGEAATPISVVLDFGDRKQVVGIDPLDCGGTTDGTVEKGDGEHFLSMVQAFWLDQRAELSLRSAPKVASGCPAPQGSLLGTVPTRAVAAHACGDDDLDSNRIEFSEDLQRRIIEDMGANSRVGQSEDPGVGQIVLTDAFGNTLTANRDTAGAYTYVMPGQSGPDSVMTWEPSDALRAEIDAALGS